jgi:drug/metabolite transporter (DMT)-like permease
MMQPSKGRALAWMSGALCGFLLMGIAARELAPHVSLYQMLVFRNGICLLLVALMLMRGGFRVVRTRRLGRHVARNVVHITGQYAWFFAIIWMPMAEVFAIEFTTPIWVALMAAMFLGERLTRWRVAAVVLGFIGVLVIVRPGAAMLDAAAFAAIGAAVCFACTYTITKSMVGEERPMTILFWMHLIQLPLGLVPALATGWVHPPVSVLPWVIGIGVAGFATHYCIAWAMRYADATVVVPLDFLRLPIGAMIGWAVYAEVLDPLVLLGAAIIIVANWANLRYG